MSVGVPLDSEKVEQAFDAWCEELVLHHGDKPVAAVLSSPAIQSMFTGEIGQWATWTGSEAQP